MCGGGRFARVLGCDPASASASFDGVVGDTLPGFRIVDGERGHRLVLEGRHRFSRYRLSFFIDGDRVRARTDAVFPGRRGRLYRAGVIGTHAHAILTKDIVRRVVAGAR